MKLRRTILAGLALAFALPAHAQADAEAPTDPYLALVEAMTEPQALAKASANASSELEEAFRSQPDTAKLEEACPGMIDALMAGTADTLKEHGSLETRLRSEAIVTFLRANLSREHAAEAAAFYASPDGQRLVMAAMSNTTVKTTLETAMNTLDDEIRYEDAMADNQTTVMNAVKDLSAEELARISGKLVGQEWFTALGKLRSRMHEAAFAVVNSDFAPELDEKLERAIDEVLSRHLEACGY